VMLVTVNKLYACRMTAVAGNLGFVFPRGLAKFAAIFRGRGDLALTREMSTFFRSRWHGADLSVCLRALANQQISGSDAISVLHAVHQGERMSMPGGKVTEQTTSGESVHSKGEENHMPVKKKSSVRKYGKVAEETVASAMRRKQHGTLRSGKRGKGGTVKSRKQAIAIGLSEARKKGGKVPRKKAA